MRPEKAKPSVCWYAPLQLLRTGRLVAIATVFGRHADPRLVEGITRDDGSQRGALGVAPFGPHDYSGQEVPFWIDYVSDTGDGWEPPTPSPTMSHRTTSHSLLARRGAGAN